MQETAHAWEPPRAWRPWFLGIFLVIASFFDAWMTLEFLALGGEEANPIAEPVTRYGSATFMVWKMCLGTFAAACLAAFCRRWRWVWIAFQAVVWTYLAITGFHLWFVIAIR